MNNLLDPHPFTHPVEGSYPDSDHRHDRLWQAIEEGIEENVFIILGKEPRTPRSTDYLPMPSADSPKDPVEQASKKIRALESAARVLARADKARSGLPANSNNKSGALASKLAASELPLDESASSGIPRPQNPKANPRSSTPTSADDASVNEMPILSAVCRTDSSALPAAAKLPHHQAEPVFPAANIVDNLTGKGQVQSLKPEFQNLKSAIRVPRSSLADLLLPEDSLLDDPKEINQSHDRARRFLGKQFDALAKNARKSIEQLEKRSLIHR